MGGISSIPDKMSANMKETQKEMMAKQILVQKSMGLKQREAQMAFQFAKGRERFYWYTGFYCTMIVGCSIAIYRGK